MEVVSNKKQWFGTLQSFKRVLFVCGNLQPRNRLTKYYSKFGAKLII